MCDKIQKIQPKPSLRLLLRCVRANFTETPSEGENVHGHIG